LWAKATPDGRWHALPFHLLDVAACSEELWRRLPSRVKEQVTRFFSDPDVAARLGFFLAASHDVGKGNRFFQAKERTQARRLRDLEVDLAQDDEPLRHGQATGALLKPWLIERWGWGNFTAECVALAVGGHHGVFFSGDLRSSPLGLNQEPWSSVGKELLDDLAAVLELPSEVPEPDPLNPFLGWLAGFVSAADWLGSHEDMTIWQSESMPLEEYLTGARARAGKLLDKLNWSTPPATAALSLKDLLPPQAEPNGLQELAAQIADKVQLAIVEAPTGEGKTEAAFALAEATRKEGAGAYFALPTMATANGLHQRVENYLRQATGKPDLETRLLHSQAWLFRDKVDVVENPDAQDGQQAAAQDWFVGSKRALLAPYGVGTIDQALIAALRAKHGFVRLFALAGKVVVVDEVHAYDVYMSDLLEVLLGWLRALGCRVFLLSATLPKARKDALLRAWGADGELPDGRYPCITWVEADGRVDCRSFDVQPRKPLTIQTLTAEEGPLWQQGAEEILRQVQKQGGLGALILNTVGDAQSAYEHLRGLRLGEMELDLFHARFTAQDRDRIEKHVLAHYGKSADRSGPRILVATQVVEQSLDLDFDHMVSALAPIDLLIQRAGRLHRHRRHADGRLRENPGPDERRNPVLWVLAPPASREHAPTIVEWVYSRDVLMRTLGCLRQPMSLAEPLDISEAIEDVYSEAGRALLPSAWRELLEELESQANAKRQQQHREAELAVAGSVENPDRLLVEAFLDLDENDERQGSRLAARTRLEERPTITLALLKDQQTTIHGGTVSDLRAGYFACVSCSPPFPLWETLLQIEPPLAWRRKGTLGHARPLLVHEGRAVLDDYEVSYDAETGLQWRKMNAEL
jgi:CRISPR-associated endonuclease/helicase Cas3